MRASASLPMLSTTVTHEGSCSGYGLSTWVLD